VNNSKKNKKKRLGSYPYLNVVFSISLALFVIGLFGLLFLHTSRLTTIIQENVQMQVYLNNSISDSQQTKIHQTLGAKPYVLEKDEQPMIEFISKEKAAATFLEQTGEDFKNFINDNPLKPAFLINIKPEYQQNNQLAVIAEEIEDQNGVFEVIYKEGYIESINNNLTKISMILLGFVVILLLVVIILINNTVKLALFSQRFLIRSMQLVGAKSSFIRRPFLLRSILLGFISGIVSSILLFSLMRYANSLIEELASLQDMNKIFILFAGLLVIGMIIGYFSTWRAINKYLKMSLDDLY
jgi:cell division transport system permease protein